jgi:hypothetical protein
MRFKSIGDIGDQGSKGTDNAYLIISSLFQLAMPSLNSGRIFTEEVMDYPIWMIPVLFSWLSNLPPKPLRRVVGGGNTLFGRPDRMLQPYRGAFPLTKISFNAIIVNITSRKFFPIPECRFLTQNAIYIVIDLRYTLNIRTGMRP